MSVEDPFFIVKDEVLQAVKKTKALYQRWNELQEDKSGFCAEELKWITNELRNSLRSIEWDVEDLEETITIVTLNPKKFKIDRDELNSRKLFVAQVQEEVKAIEEKMFDSKDRKARQSLLGSGPSHAKYTRLQSEADSPTQNFFHETQLKQQEILHEQDEELDLIQDTVGTLKTMSRSIGTELDEQAVMLDDLGYEMDNTESRLDTTMKKLAKTLHLSSDRRQWIAIIVLSVIMIIVITLFFIL